jgi:hypothetical protein
MSGNIQVAECVNVVPPQVSASETISSASNAVSFSEAKSKRIWEVQSSGESAGVRNPSIGSSRKLLTDEARVHDVMLGNRMHATDAPSARAHDEGMHDVRESPAAGSSGNQQPLLSIGTAVHMATAAVRANLLHDKGFLYEDVGEEGTRTTYLGDAFAVENYVAVLQVRVGRLEGFPKKLVRVHVLLSFVHAWVMCTCMDS